MKRTIACLALLLTIGLKANAITVPLAFGVTGNSAASANSVAYRDNAGNFDIGGATATIGVVLSSATFIGVELSTQAAGTAGTAVTATCRTPGTFALGGGCSCGTVVAGTSVVSVPNVVTAGSVVTGWTCQVAGGTGGQCSAYVICSRAQ